MAAYRAVFEAYTVLQEGDADLKKQKNKQTTTDHGVGSSPGENERRLLPSQPSVAPRTGGQSGVTVTHAFQNVRLCLPPSLRGYPAEPNPDIPPVSSCTEGNKVGGGGRGGRVLLCANNKGQLRLKNVYMPSAADLRESFQLEDGRKRRGGRYCSVGHMVRSLQQK